MAVSKLKKCYWWPDHRPPEGTITDRKFHKLTYILPVYKYWYDWFYLAECECGKEVITKPYTTRFCHACGIKETYEEKQETRFNSKKHCRRGNYTCKHYAECLSDRVFNRKQVSARFKDGCYKMTDEETRVCVETPDASFPVYRSIP